MSAAFTVWAGVAVAIILAVLHEALWRRIVCRKKRIMADFEQHIASTRARNKRRGEGDE